MSYQSKFTGAEIDERLEQTDTIPLVVDEVLNLPNTHDNIVVGYMNSIDLDSLNKMPQENDRFWGICKTTDKYVYGFVAQCTGEITESDTTQYAQFEFIEIVLLHDGSLDEELENQGAKLYLHEVTFTTAEEDENHILRLVSDSSTPFEYDGGNGGIYIGEDKILNAKFGYDGVEYNDCLLTYEYSNDGAIENIAYIERSGTIRSIDITTIVESSLSDTVTEI